jgi:uncharacterized membrane protein YcgQ (UPF0703/DUF1980 family)
VSFDSRPKKTNSKDKIAEKLHSEKSSDYSSVSTEQEYLNIRKVIQNDIKNYKRKTIHKMKGKAVLKASIKEKKLFLHSFLHTIESSIFKYGNDELWELIITK